jgi:hypothetical protein
VFLLKSKTKKEEKMKNKFMLMAAGTIFGLVMLAGNAQFFVSGQESTNESSREPMSSRSIVGTWQTLVTPRNCQTGVLVAPAFPGLLTFNKGGTLSGTSTAVSSAYGVWEKTHGSRNYSFAFISLRYSPTGAFIGTQKVRQTAELAANGNQFTTTGSVEVLDVSGNIVATGCSTATGARFE